MVALVATLYLTCARHAQEHNQILSLDGAVFPAGLTMLGLVSFYHCRLCFAVCVCALQGACGVDVA